MVGFNISFDAMVHLAPLLRGETFHKIVQIGGNGISGVINDVLKQCIGRHIQRVDNIAERVHLSGLEAPLNYADMHRA